MAFTSNDCAEFVKISKYVGQRFDLIQAGGGNISVKSDDGIMFIKASGIGLSEVEIDKGYSAFDCLKNTLIDGSPKPSIETPMHVLLDTWVVHTHPLAVGMVVCRPDWKTVLSGLFPAALLIDYCSPGHELASALLHKSEALGLLPHIIFLQNHGLVVHGQNSEMVLQETEKIISALEQFLGVDFSSYKQTTSISGLVQQAIPSFNGIAYLSDDAVLKVMLKTRRDLFSVQPICPDAFVYGGYEVVFVSSGEAFGIKAYWLKYTTYPRVIIYEGNLFFLAPSVRKAQEAEAVVKAQIIMLFHGQGKVQSLAFHDLNVLAGMSSEQYRQNC